MYYFAYGSNMDQADLDRWCEEKGFKKIHFKQVIPAKLVGYQLLFNYYSLSRAGGAANIQESTDHGVYGLLVELEDQHLLTIRAKEGFPRNYDEIFVDVEGLDGTTYQDVVTYQVVPAKRTSDHQPPSRYYLDLIIHNARKYGFPMDYIRMLEGVRHQQK
ncbi:gamma-glutamylcyclotransferase family protein [Ammoniphilus sp. CFH 90114]|uniref:gamma-glutamylcyclotransferase family protein n=1 Tax=Ammoniphilus sp. CFH 90114 TaxID=2493665 RepID=UPI00100E2083|nr:gamma-glutamylcyclotransferase family protein [Ammoniphilus sp. CFH 90114]RXT01544.1 gamma-glutamylcyclotransferase [Ammoniphilus sp. CFH 90114]